MVKFTFASRYLESDIDVGVVKEIKMASNQKHICDKCKKIINLRTQKYIIWEEICKKEWHVPKFFDISEEQHSEITRNVNKSLLCDPCKEKRRHRKSLMYDVPLSSAISNTNQLKSNAGPAKTDTGFQVTLELIYKEIKSIREEQTNYQRKLDGLKTVIENIELRNEIDILHNKINNVDHLMDTQDQHGLDCN